MKVISVLFVFMVFFSLIATAVTGRKQWLVIWIWCLPVLGLIYHLPKEVTVDGLVVLISMVMSIEVAYSVWGIKLWCVQTRKKNRILVGIISLFNFLLTYYCFSQSLELGYFGEVRVENSMSVFVISIVLSFILTWIMQDISISTVEKFFSKKEEFPIINCKPIKRKRKIYGDLYRRYAIEGIQNGQDYVFFMTRKAYLVLKQQRSFVFNAKRGVLGGVYVTSSVYDGDSKRRLKRVNRLLIRRGLFVLLLFVLFLLFVIRITTGETFETIFAQIGRGVQDWIR